MTALSIATFFPPSGVRHGRFLHLRDGRKVCVTKDHEPVTSDLIEAHLGLKPRRGWQALGYLPCIQGEAGDSLTTVGMIDLDAKTYEGLEPDALEVDRRRLRDVAERRGWFPYFERSSRGFGWHAYLFTEEPLPLEVMAQVLRQWAHLALIHRASSVETYPANGNPAGRWQILPYADAASDENRLGSTYLETVDGAPIPFDELTEWITRTPNSLLDLQSAPEASQETESAPSVINTSPEGVEALKRALLSPRMGFERHGSIAAVLNIADRMGERDTMIDFLKSDELRSAWVSDGSRSEREWAEEIDRWARAQDADRRYGFPFLKSQGFSIPNLKRESTRPEIVVNDRHLRDITTDALRVLETQELYTRADLVIRVTNGRAERMTNPALKGTLERAADFVKVTHDEKGNRRAKPARVPTDLPPDILSLPASELPFPKLEGIAHAPILTPNGTLLESDGYDPVSGLLLDLQGIQNLRSDLSLEEAVGWIDELLWDFPFVDEASRAHTFCLLLQPTVRHVIQGATPMYGVDAPIRGAGKGLLIDVCALVQTGRTAPVMPLTRDGEELDKRITTLLLDGSTHILFDNVTELGGNVLPAVLTSRVWRGRILGRSEMVHVRNDATWIASGNNIELSDEIARRWMPIRLDPNCERPEERTDFRHSNLKVWTTEHRTETLSAVLSIVQAWVEAGMPMSSASLGSYESWAGVMGGILEIAGVPGLLGGRDRLHDQAERETNEWAAFLTAWFGEFDGLPVTAGDVFAILRSRRLLLDVWGGRNDLRAQQRLGHALKARRDRVFGGLKILAAGRDGTTNSNTYRLEPVEDGTEPRKPRKPPEPHSSSSDFILSTSRADAATLEDNRGADGDSGVSGVHDRPDAKTTDSMRWRGKL